MKLLTFVSLFAGVGGFDIGFERAGLKCIGQVERDPRAREILERRFPGVLKHDDVLTAEGWAHEHGMVGATDIVCGGFPCQDVSVAGRRAGLAGERSGLFWPALAFAETVKARWFVLENVPGLLSSNEGRDFGVVLSALADAGYSHVEWRVLDSQFFGVPQRRRRVFIVASAGDIGRRQVLTESESLRGYSAESESSEQVTTTAITSSLGTGGPDDNQAQGNQLIPYVKSRRARSDQDYETWLQRSVSPTLNTFDNGAESRATVLAFYSTGGGNDAPADDLSPTVKVGSGKSCAPVAIASEQAVRRLTPVECERLQGFPDGWTEGVADSHRYRQMGNAVTVNVANYIGDCIRRCS